MGFLGFGKTKEIPLGKEILRILVVSIMSAVLLGVFGYLLNALVPYLGAVGGIVFVAIVALGLFFWSKALHPGDEIGIVEFIPVFIILGVLYGLGLPKVEIGTATFGVKFAMLLSSIYISDVVYRKYLMK